MKQNAGKLEKEAQALLSQHSDEQAYELMKKAAYAYRNEGQCRQAAYCFAAAASIWGNVYGDKSFYASAQLFKEAAMEAEKYHDYDYAALLYKYAAVNYERDWEYNAYADCFYFSKECRRKLLMKFPKGLRWQEYLLQFCRWCISSLSCVVWGYGEKPFRTLAIWIVVFEAFCGTFIFPIFIIALSRRYLRL